MVLSIPHIVSTITSHEMSLAKTIPKLNYILNRSYHVKPKLQTSNYVNSTGKYCIIKTSFHKASILHKIIPFTLSDIGEGIREVSIKEWYIQVGDQVSQFDNICEVQSDKASVTITSRYDGIIKKLYHNIDETAFVGKPLIDIEIDGDNGANSVSESSSVERQTKSVLTESSEQSAKQLERSAEKLMEAESRGLAIPSVRRLAKEHNLNIFNIEGTGKDRRVLKEDVLNYLERQKISSQLQSSVSSIEPIKGLRKAMVKTMTHALKIPHFVYSDEMNTTKLLDVRNVIKEECIKNNLKISFMPYFIKAVSNALLRFPMLNATVDDNCENITYQNLHHIGIAMDTKLGLAVPVIKNVQSLTIVEIAKELNSLMINGKDGKFTNQQLSDGTFTISNIGAIGGTYMKPIILPPQLAIVAIGAIKRIPQFDDLGNISPANVTNISAAADHRIIDGATMARFINHVKKQIENPYLLFLNL